MTPAVQFSTGDRIAKYQKEVDELLLVIAKYLIEDEESPADWVAEVFVSDESRIADFLSSDVDVAQIGDELGLLSIRRLDLVCTVAETLHQMKIQN